jgi:uncharacterized membrane protein YgcG
VASDTPEAPLTHQPPTLIFRGYIRIPRLCQGAYTIQRSLVNYGDSPVTDASLAWEVIEGAQLVEAVTINPASLMQAGDQAAPGPADSSANQNPDSPAEEISDDPVTFANYADLPSIDVEQDLKLKVKVKVKEDWWEASSGTEIKVKLSVKSKLDLGREHDGRADHEPDRHHREPGQIITIVKQDTKWVTLTGPAHHFDDQSLLVDGHIVALSSCTGLPLELPPGAKVKVIGLLQPDGTFIAINITIINVTIINGDFNSGVPVPGPDDDDGGSRGGSSGGSGGGSRGGSKGGSGGSRGGSKGSH